MPFIKRDFIGDLPNKVDIIAVINKRVPLTKKGRDYKACCPFHQEKTPSFSVSPTKQAYYCFGCGEGGHAIDFVKKFDNLEFTEAVERLASEFGIEVEYDSHAQPADKTFEKLLSLSQKISEFYTTQLKTSPFKQIAVEYAENRDISGAIAKRFEIGFAPININLHKEFSNNAETIKNLLTLGLIIKDDNNTSRYFDRFRDRLMFPIHNTKGKVIAFGGRVLNDSKKTAKYLNSSESPIFNKSSELYGLNLARKHTRSLSYLLVVEGYMDVVALHQGGITACVATLGTATTTQHLQILKRNTNTIIFCFDGDKAGLNAAVKALNITLPIIAANMEIKFLFLPDNEDPDSLIKKEGKIKFEERIENATTLSEFLFSHLKQAINFTTIEGKTKFLERAKILIETVNYKLYQQQLIQGLALEVGDNFETINKYILKQQNTKHSHQLKVTNYQNMDETNQVMKNLLAKLISVVLSNPDAVDDELFAKIKKIPQTEILQEIIKSIDFEENPNTEILIRPFKSQKKIYDRLWHLAKSTVVLNPNNARLELNTTIAAIEKCQNKQIRQQQIADSNNLSTQEQKEIVKNLQQKSSI